MSKYLRDEFVKNLDITESALVGLNELFTEIAASANAGLQENDPHFLRLRYVIRFDHKGFTLTAFDRLLSYFRTARLVERVIIQMDSANSLNRAAGKAVDLSFWIDDPNKCILTVQDDDSEWTDSVFLRIKEQVDNRKNRFRSFLRTPSIYLLLQLSTIVTIFLFAFLAALKTSVYFAPPNVLGILLVLYLIIFSTIWTYLNPIIQGRLNRLCPSIKFKELTEAEWLIRVLLGAAIVAVIGFAINEAMLYASETIKPLLK